VGRHGLALLFGLGLVALAEGLCALLGWGTPDWGTDPFVSFRGTEPLFVPDGASGYLMTSSRRRRFFEQERFAHPKPPGTFRVFCFGGSTVQGNPYGRLTAFSTWLQLGLEAADPSRHWEVINCGGLSYASYRVLPLMTECRTYEPDLFILCTGHNEFLEERTYGPLKHAPAGLAWTLETVSRLRLFHVLQRAWRQVSDNPAPPRRALLPEEVDALLDYRGGLAAYHRDPEWRRGVVAHFAANLHRAVGLCREADIPLMLINPVSNLRDCPPFKSESAPGLSPSVVARRDRLLTEAVALLPTDPATAAVRLETAAALDDQYARTFYLLGRAWEANGRLAAAGTNYRRARELDVCPLRILSPMEAALRETARAGGVPFVDWQALIAARSPGGLPGHEWLVDHVHPTPAGHRILALALIEAMARQGWVRLPDDWRTRVEAAWNRHEAALPADYFTEGEKALAGLRAWTQGRADGPPIEYRQLHPVGGNPKTEN
jgi:lysophospholipase L1-like esterase